MMSHLWLLLAFACFIFVNNEMPNRKNIVFLMFKFIVWQILFMSTSIWLMKQV